MDSYGIVVCLAVINAHGTKCPADSGIKFPLAVFFSFTTSKRGGKEKKDFSVSFHVTLVDSHHHLQSVNFSTLETFLVAHSFN